MILVLSSSSPLVSVALFDQDALVSSGQHMADRNATQALLSLTREVLGAHGVPLNAIQLFAADVGPGSFVGTRVGVMVAKTLAYSLGTQCAELSAFELMPSGVPLVIPFRRGEAFLKLPGEEPTIVSEWPANAVGYLPDTEPRTYPLAHVARVGFLKPVDPVHLLPHHGAQPSISLPKTPFRPQES